MMISLRLPQARRAFLSPLNAKRSERVARCMQWRGQSAWVQASTFDLSEKTNSKGELQPVSTATTTVPQRLVTVTPSPPRRYLSSQPDPKSSSRSQKSLRLPNGALGDKIRFILSDVPVGSMNEAHVDFCNKTMNLLSQRLENRGEVAEKLLERLVEELSTRNPAIDPARVAVLYNGAMRAWARTTDTEKPPVQHQLPRPVARAKLLLDRMHSRHQEHPDMHPPPDVYAHDAVLYACASSSYSELVAPLAEELVKAMEESVRQNLETAIIPSTISYNNLISVYANQAPTHYGAATAAEDWLMHLSKLSAEGFGGAEPDTGSFNRVLKAWSTSPEKNGADRAREILDLMLSLQVEHRQLQPDMISFATVIHAFGKRRQPEKGESVFRQAIEYFDQEYQRRDKSTLVDSKEEDVADLTNCLNGAIFAWAQSNSPDAPERVEALLRDAYILSKHHRLSSSSHIRIQPDASSHTALMNTLIQSGRPDGIDAAHRHLKEMIASFVSKGDNAVAPTTPVFHAVIHGWLQSERPEAAERAQELLQDMLELSEKRNAPSCSPETKTIIRCIDLWSKHESPIAAAKALELLNLAEKRKLVSFFTYQSVVNILCKWKASIKAARVLERLESQADKGNVKLQSSILHIAVIDGLADLKTQDAAELALQIFNRMKTKKMEATTYTYTCILAAFSELRTKRSGEVAFLLFEEMKELDADRYSRVKLSSFAFDLTLETLARAGDKISADNARVVQKHKLKALSEGRAKT
jgi:pentatricopeptide repeat protein